MGLMDHWNDFQNMLNVGSIYDPTYGPYVYVRLVDRSVVLILLD